MILRKVFLGLIFWTAVLFTAEARRPLSPLAEEPDWSRLAPFQETITRTEFLNLLNTLYAPDGSWKGSISVGPDSATIRQPGGRENFVLRFAPSREAAKPVPRYWKPAGSLKTPASKPLEGYTIAIDPGHIGGKWAKMEERWFKIGDSKPVMEGEMALYTARLLRARLEALGAKVVLIRENPEPVTPLRPKDLKGVAKEQLARQGVKKPRKGYNGPNDPQKFNSIDWQSELLFYRTAEIRARAKRVNEVIKPDLVIALHFNAEEWGDPAKPTLTEKNHLHMLVNGNYGPGELSMADIRFDMLMKLLTRTGREELPLSDEVAASLAKATQLPPFIYHGKNARRVTESPYVWARNLLATRLYHCPVIYCEPYVMNSVDVFARAQAGDYEGVREINGIPRKSLFREYADAVAEGVAAYFASRRPR